MPLTKITPLFTSRGRRIERGPTLGLFSYLVTLSIKQLEENAYGLRITKHLISTLSEIIDPGQVYLTLKRLEERGLVESTQVTLREGARVKQYRLTTSGINAMTATANYVRAAIEIGESDGNGAKKRRSISRPTVAHA